MISKRIVGQVLGLRVFLVDSSILWRLQAVTKVPTPAVGVDLSYFHLFVPRPSRVVPANQTKKGRFASQLKKKGCFLNSERFFLDKRRDLTETPTFVKITDFCEFSLFLRKDTLNSENNIPFSRIGE